MGFAVDDEALDGDFAVEVEMHLGVAVHVEDGVGGEGRGAHELEDCLLVGVVRGDGDGAGAESPRGEDHEGALSDVGAAGVIAEAADFQAVAPLLHEGRADLVLVDGAEDGKGPAEVVVPEEGGFPGVPGVPDDEVGRGGVEGDAGADNVGIGVGTHVVPVGEETATREDDGLVLQVPHVGGDAEVDVRPDAAAGLGLGVSAEAGERVPPDFAGARREGDATGGVEVFAVDDEVGSRFEAYRTCAEGAGGGGDNGAGDDVETSGEIAVGAESEDARSELLNGDGCGAGLADAGGEVSIGSTHAGIRIPLDSERGGLRDGDGANDAELEAAADGQDGVGSVEGEGADLVEAAGAVLGVLPVPFAGAPDGQPRIAGVLKRVAVVRSPDSRLGGKESDGNAGGVPYGDDASCPERQEGSIHILAVDAV